MTLRLRSYRLALALGATREPKGECISVQAKDNAPVLFWPLMVEVKV
jgi:hypothetical protein